MNLRALQMDFQAFILAGDMAVTDRLSARSRPAIYAHAYRARLSEVLASEFEKLAAYLGTEKFDRLAQDYIQAHLSHQPSARHYGQHLPAFLKSHALSLDDPALSDIARVEAGLRNAFDGPDHDPISIAAIAAIDPSRWAHLVLSFHTNLALIPCDHRVDGLWSDSPIIYDQSCIYLIWRLGLVPMYRALEPLEYAILQAALAGRTFGDLCALIAIEADPDQAPMIAAGLMRNWVEHGLIIGAAQA